MVATNFVSALSFVWRAGFDSPRDGYHETPDDPGGGTYGGVTEATWAAAVRDGIVAKGALRDATLAQLSAILRSLYWLEELPAGLDLLVFNGRMMTGRYPHILQQCLGLSGASVDGVLGPATLARIAKADASTLIAALTGVHLAYLSGLLTWHAFGAGWTTRILAAGELASRMVSPPVS